MLESEDEDGGDRHGQNGDLVDRHQEQQQIRSDIDCDITSVIEMQYIAH